MDTQAAPAPLTGRRRLAALGAVALVAFAITAAVRESGALAPLEREALKTRFDVRGTEGVEGLVVVGIDADTFTELNHNWPFPRKKHAELVRLLHKAGVRSIVYDVQFTEPTRRDQDLALYDALGDAGGAIMATSESDGHGHTRVLGGDANLRAINARAAASDLRNDTSGAIASFPREVGGLESIAVATTERLTHHTPDPAGFRDGRAWIDYRGPPGTIPTVKFVDVLKNRVPDSVLKDKIVVVGGIAPTLRDVHSTPVGGEQLMAGAEVQANAIWTAMHGLPLRSAPPWVDLLLLALLALLPPLVRWRLPLGVVGVATVVAGAAFVVVAQVAFESGTIVDVAAPLLALILGAFGAIAWSEFAERRVRYRVSRDNELLEQRVRERTADLADAEREIAHRLGVAVEWRDAETGVHIERMGRLCERLAREVGLSVVEAELLRHASALHDVGKVGIPDEILLKPAKLDPAEWAKMKTHTTIGASILSGSKSALVQMAEQIARSHHERWDGSGYPDGLKGDEIPLIARICAVCDVFDALLSPRPYKAAWPLPDVIRELGTLRGTHLDPALVDAFLPLAMDLYEECFAPYEPARPQTDAQADAAA
ncbi:MAG TPA: CHASE2 domain-containing protein [Thermoleophilaceae bacterium]|nr:CHASE2 domain-containing protein [Thermoleophilaceae bacterium]